MILEKTIKNVSAKWLGFLILIILFAFLNYNGKTLIFNESENLPVTVTQDFLKMEFPEMDRVVSSNEQEAWNTVYDSVENILGYYVISEFNRWNYSGYAGGIPIFIKLSSEKTIDEIKLLENRETRRFLFKLYNLKFLHSWKGMTLKEASESDIDSVSGVTLSSNTIIANLSEILDISEGFSPMSRINYKQMIVKIAQLVLFLYALFSFFIKSMKRYRMVYLVSLIVLFGFVAGDFISVAMMRGFLTGAVSFLSNPILWLLFISSIIIPIFTNKAFYCTHLCPFGAAQELAGKLTNSKNKIPQRVKMVFQYSRPVLFGIITLIVILDYKVDLSLVEPFAAFLYTVAAPFTIGLALVSLFFSIYYSKPWCRWLCPTGQFLDYFRT